MTTARLLLLGLIVAGAVGLVAPRTPHAQAPAASDEPPEVLDIDDPTIYPEVAGPAEDRPPAEMFFCFDLVQRQREIAVEPNTPFDIYLLATNSRWGVRGWEAKLVIDPRIKILEADYEGVNVGQENNWFVGILPRKCKLGDTAQLARFSAMVIDPDARDLVLGIAPTDRSSYDPPAPGYLVCKPTSQLLTYAASDTSAVVNPVAIDLQGEDTPRGLFEPARGKIR